MEDRQIVMLYLQRNEKAIVESKTSYGRYLLTIAQNILNNESDSLEAENDTYLSAWNSIPPEEPRSLKTYLARIIRNISIDMYRKNHAEKRGGAGADILLSELMETLPNLEPSVLDNDEDSREIANALNEFLKDLEKQKRIIFVKRYFYGESVENIARDLGLSTSNVSTTLHRLRTSLKLHFEKEGVAI